MVHLFLHGLLTPITGTSASFLGAWLCHEVDLPQIFSTASAEPKIGSQDWFSGLPKGMHLFRTPTGNEGHWESYDAWRIAAARTLIHVASVYPHKAIIVHILNPNPDFAGQERIQQSLYTDLTEALGERSSATQIAISFGFACNEVLLPREEIVSIADLLCTTAATKSPLVASNMLTGLDREQEVHSETTILTQLIARRQKLANVMLRLCQLGTVSEARLYSVAQHMSATDWQELCRLLEIHLVGQLTEGEQRYLELDESYAFAQTVPWQHAGKMQERVRYQILRGIQKVMAHRGETSQQLVESLEGLIASPMVFANELERLQARIDVVLDDVQHRLINTMSPNPNDVTLTSLLELYETYFGKEGSDSNRARLHGTIGQLFALRAHFLETNAGSQLELAMENFAIDERNSQSEYDLRIAIGYQVACAFQMGDLERLQTDHLRERQHYLGEMPSLTSVAWQEEQLASSSFLVLHDLQRHALAVHLGRPAPQGIADFVLAWDKIQINHKEKYPICLIGKWLSILLWQTKQFSTAQRIAQECGTAKLIGRQRPIATQWIHLICAGVAMELKEATSGIGYVKDNLEVVRAWQPQLVSVFLSRLDRLETRPPAERVWGLATLLPFYFT